MYCICIIKEKITIFFGMVNEVKWFLKCKYLMYGYLNKYKYLVMHSAEP